MKKVVLSIILASAVLVGCADAYEAKQPTNRSDERQVFADAEQIEQGVIGLYSNFNIESEINFVSYFTDELGVGITNGGQGVNDGTYTFQMTPANGFATGEWGTDFNMINRINRMLNRIDDLYEETPEDKESLNSSKATLLAFRAYANYRLFAYFTPDYTDVNGPSIIKFDFLQTDDYNREEARATVGEIVSFIEEDIKDARELGLKGIDNSELSESFLDAILVKLYSMTENYDGLEEAFNRLAETHGVGTALEYWSTFVDSDAKLSNPDIILRLQRSVYQGESVASAWYSDLVGINAGMIYMEIGRSLYNELDKLDPNYQGKPLSETDKDGNLITYDRNDARYVNSVLSESLIEPDYSSLSQDEYKVKDVLLVGKYPGRTQNSLQNDVYVFRFTDMLLSLAEKRAHENKLTGPHEEGNYSSVESIIYNIRLNRNMLQDGTVLSMPTNFENPQQAYARILEERRVEFAFEGYRYLDMRRLGVKAGSLGFVRDAMDCASTGACELEPNSYKLVLPIPSTEMISNSKMKGHQNPGY